MLAALVQSVAGFAVDPRFPRHPMVERWKEHLFENICNRANQADWLTGWSPI